MTTDDIDSSADQRDEGEDVTSSAVGTGYKVLGENDATSGTPVGVEGRVPNADGFGIATPDDARVDGDLLASALAGGITGGNRVTDMTGPGLSVASGQLGVDAGVSVAPTLPPYETVGDDPQAVTDPMATLFDETAWADLSYSSGPSHGEGSMAFAGGVVVPTGEIVLIPYKSDHVGIFDPTMSTYTTGPAHNEVGSDGIAFFGGALSPTGEVIFAPYSSSNVGVYDPDTNTYSSGDSVGSDGFTGATLAATGEVVFPPLNGYVGVYDPVADSYSRGPSVSNIFSNSALAPTGEVVFGSFDDPVLGVYDPSTTDFSTVSFGSSATIPFQGATLTPSGNVVLVPAGNDSVGIFDPGTNTFFDGATVGDDSFWGGVLSPTGDVVFLPHASNTVGIYDPRSDTYTSGPAHGENASAFIGGALAPNGRIVCAPHESGDVGILDTHAQVSKPHPTCHHPLVNGT